MTKFAISQPLILQYFRTHEKRTARQIARDLGMGDRDQIKRLENMLRHMWKREKLQREVGGDSAYRYYLRRRFEPARIPWLLPEGMRLTEYRAIYLNDPRAKIDMERLKEPMAQQ